MACQTENNKKDLADLNELVRTATSQIVKNEFARFIERIKAEGERFATALGFQPGPRLRRQLRRELEFWEAGGFEFYQLKPGTHPRTAEWARVRCLVSLDVSLSTSPHERQRYQFRARASRGISRDASALHAQSWSGAGRADFAMWLKSKRECTADRISELESKLAEAKDDLNGLR